MGPVEVVIVTFADAGRLSGIAPLLQQLADAGHARIADALVVTRGRLGRPVVSEPDDTHIAGWSRIGEHTQPLLNADDAALAAEEIGDDGAAVVLVIEHTWPDTLRQLAEESGGVIALHTRVDTATVEEATRVDA